MTGIDDQERRTRRTARREARQARFDTSVPSPCISVCQMDSDNRYCLGCRRSIDEIREWPILSAEEKRAVLALLAARR
ncbi:MAG: DUF1289 domain-containing protein [Kiloniellales bacterium]